jgi:rhodanese-related sulfurtransferase
MLSFLNPSRAARIAPAEAISRQARGEITLVDVRDISELRATGRAKGAIHLPLMLLPQKADPRHPEHDPALSVDRPVVVYCASGARSARAAEILTALGYAQVYNLGGLGDWAAAGGAITR